MSEHLLWIKLMSTSCEAALGWMPQNIFDEKSTLVQVMAGCRQATSYYLSQCLRRSVSPHGVTSILFKGNSSIWGLNFSVLFHRGQLTITYNKSIEAGHGLPSKGEKLLPEQMIIQFTDVSPGFNELSSSHSAKSLKISDTILSMDSSTKCN